MKIILMNLCTDFVGWDSERAGGAGMRQMFNLSGSGPRRGSRASARGFSKNIVAANLHGLSDQMSDLGWISTVTIAASCKEEHFEWAAKDYIGIRRLRGRRSPAS